MLIFCDFIKSPPNSLGNTTLLFKVVITEGIVDYHYYLFYGQSHEIPKNGCWSSSQSMLPRKLMTLCLCVLKCLQQLFHSNSR